MSCAFPTLFPTGATDFVAPRQHAVTIGNYFKHLMMYEDGRFAKHPRFRYFALNTESSLAWFPDAPDVERVLASTDSSDAAKQELLQYVDRIVTTVNPAILPDRSNADAAPPPKTDPTSATSRILNSRISSKN